MEVLVAAAVEEEEEEVVVEEEEEDDDDEARGRFFTSFGFEAVRGFGADAVLALLIVSAGCHIRGERERKEAGRRKVRERRKDARKRERNKQSKEGRKEGRKVRPCMEVVS